MDTNTSKKRLQIALSDEAWSAVDSLAAEASRNFEVGSINYSDVINEMILSSKVDVKMLQAKHTDLRRAIRSMTAKDEVDLDAIIKGLMELKAKTGGRKLARAANATADTTEEQS